MITDYHKKLIFILTMMLTIQQNMLAQCNQGLNLGAVIVPTHGNSANGGNYFNAPSWQEAATWLETFDLDYSQRYITWTDVVQQITDGVPTYNTYSGFENALTTWSGEVVQFCRTVFLLSKSKNFFITGLKVNFIPDR